MQQFTFKDTPYVQRFAAVPFTTPVIARPGPTFVRLPDHYAEML